MPSVQSCVVNESYDMMISLESIVEISRTLLLHRDAVIENCWVNKHALLFFLDPLARSSKFYAVMAVKRWTPGRSSSEDFAQQESEFAEN